MRDKPDPPGAGSSWIQLLGWWEKSKCSSLHGESEVWLCLTGQARLGVRKMQDLGLGNPGINGKMQDFRSWKCWD